MATPRKMWPKNAEWARIDSLIAATKAREALEAAANAANPGEAWRQISIASFAISKIEVSLAQVGPKEMAPDERFIEGQTRRA